MKYWLLTVFHAAPPCYFFPSPSALYKIEVFSLAFSEDDLLELLELFDLFPDADDEAEVDDALDFLVVVAFFVFALPAAACVWPDLP